MTNKKVLSNFTWRLFERILAQGVTLVVSMILARLLDPEAYGIVAITSVIISIMSIFIDSGFGQALVQKKDTDELDFSSVFYFNLLMCIALYVLVFFTAPLIASIFKMDAITPIIRAQGITLLISGVKSIQQAYVSKHMQFKLFFFSTLGGTIGAAVLGVWMAYHGFGVWALVAQSLLNNFVDTVILWITVKWRPSKAFSLKRIKTMFGFGSRLMLSSLIYTSYYDLRQLVVGKISSSANLAYYNRGYSIPSMINSLISTSIGSVVFPVMAEEQDDQERLKMRIKSLNQLYSYVLTPLLVGLCLCAKPIILVMFSKGWEKAIPFLRVFSLTFLFEGIGLSNLNAIKAKGYSKIVLRIEIIKTVLNIAILIVTAFYGVMAMAVGVVVGVYASELMCAFPSKKIFNYSLTRQLLDILPILLLSGIMAVFVYLVSFLRVGNLIMLISQVVVGAIVYIIGSIVFKIPQYYFIVEQIKRLRGTRV